MKSSRFVTLDRVEKIISRRRGTDKIAALPSSKNKLSELEKKISTLSSSDKRVSFQDGVNVSKINQLAARKDLTTSEKLEELDKMRSYESNTVEAIKLITDKIKELSRSDTILRYRAEEKADNIADKIRKVALEGRDIDEVRNDARFENLSRRFDMTLSEDRARRLDLEIQKELDKPSIEEKVEVFSDAMKRIVDDSTKVLGDRISQLVQTAPVSLRPDTLFHGSVTSRNIGMQEERNRTSPEQRINEFLTQSELRPGSVRLDPSVVESVESELINPEDTSRVSANGSYSSDPFAPLPRRYDGDEDGNPASTQSAISRDSEPIIQDSSTSTVIRGRGRGRAKGKGKDRGKVRFASEGDDESGSGFVKRLKDEFHAPYRASKIKDSFPLKEVEEIVDFPEGRKITNIDMNFLRRSIADYLLDHGEKVTKEKLDKIISHYKKIFDRSANNNQYRKDKTDSEFAFLESLHKHL